MQQFLKRNNVPCNGCSLCCQRDIIRLENDELKHDYQTDPHPFIIGARMLAHKANGECIYLEEDGCGIHDRAPLLCRIADCRSIAAKYDFETARRLHENHFIDIRVWDQGRKLIESELHKDGKQQTIRRSKQSA